MRPFLRRKKVRGQLGRIKRGAQNRGNFGVVKYVKPRCILRPPVISGLPSASWDSVTVSGLQLTGYWSGFQPFLPGE